MSKDTKTQNSTLCCSSIPVDPDLKKRIKELCGEDVDKCYQCGECTAGCPAGFTMEIAPNQVMRMAQVGMKDELLKSHTIWLCAGCETCATRCPRGVALSKVMDACRQICIMDGVKPAEENVVAFHEEFLKAVKRGGRVHEISLIGFYKLRSRQFFSDVFQGIQMFLKGKLGIIPSIIRGKKEVRGLFDKKK
ncbi:MAG: 4Fe-4S dicluster domain-containing protein [Armatimonadota bacterium]